MRELAPLLLPLRFVGAFARSFHPAELPPMLRRTYGRELVSWAFLPLMLGAIEGGTIAIVIKKAFSGQPGIDPYWLDLATAWVGAAPNVANLTSFIWAALARGRPKVAFISWLQIATCLMVAGIACVPLLTRTLSRLLARLAADKLWRWPAAWLARSSACLSR